MSSHPQEDEELREKLDWVNSCKCERCNGKDWHKQDATGCPSCDWCHDDYPLFRNSEVKRLITTARNQTLAEVREQMLEQADDHYNGFGKVVSVSVIQQAIANQGILPNSKEGGEK
jgi:hypothetical protein